MFISIPLIAVYTEMEPKDRRNGKAREIKKHYLTLHKKHYLTLHKKQSIQSLYSFFCGEERKIKN